jgi:hypothetical protein
MAQRQAETATAFTCDIGPDGQLLENGCNPFNIPKEMSSIGVQYEQSEEQPVTSAGGRRGGVPAALASPPSKAAAAALLKESEAAEKRRLADFAVTAPPSAQSLSLATGLLGLEAHHAPAAWAESWLTFQDSLDRKMGLAGERTRAAIIEDVMCQKGTDPRSDILKAASALARDRLAEKSREKREQEEWQDLVLSRLQDLVNASTNDPSGTPSSSIWGPNFQEHLTTAQYVLERITHLVGVLADPERSERPIPA